MTSLSSKSGERNALEESASRLLRLCGHRLYHASPASRSQAAALHVLEAEGPLSQKELQSRMMVQSASITELINKLEHRGLVVRERSKEDHRCVHLSLTAAGYAQSRHFREHAEETVTYSALSDAEISQLVSLLQKVIAGWEEERASAYSAF